MKRLEALCSAYRAIDSDVSYQFDALRGFSAFAVLIAHAYLVFIYPIWPALMVPLYLLGHAGVMALFAMSGFLICKSACRNVSENGMFQWREYATSRLNRILPPFYFGWLFLLTLYALSPYLFASGSREFVSISASMSQAKMSLTAEAFLGSLLFVNGFITPTPVANFAFWTLSFEVWFYTLFALLLWRKRCSTLVALLLLIILSSLNVSFLCYTLVWAGGAAAAIAHSRTTRFNRAWPIAFVSLSLLSGALGMAYFYCFMPPGGENQTLLVIFGTVIGLWICALVYSVTYRKVRLRLPGYRLAKSSYTLYILHFPLLLFIYGIAQPYVYINGPVTLAFTCLSCALCLILSRGIAPFTETLKIIKR